MLMGNNEKWQNEGKLQAVKHALYKINENVWRILQYILDNGIQNYVTEDSESGLNVEPRLSLSCFWLGLCAPEYWYWMQKFSLDWK